MSNQNITEQLQTANFLQEAGYVKPRKSLKKILFGLVGIRELPPLSSNVQFFFNRTTGAVLEPGLHFSLLHFIPGAVKYVPVTTPEQERNLDVTTNPPGTEPEDWVGFQTAPGYRVRQDQTTSLPLDPQSEEYRLAKRALRTTNDEARQAYHQALSQRIPGLVRIEPVQNEQGAVLGISAQVAPIETISPQIVQFDGNVKWRINDALLYVKGAGESPIKLMEQQTFIAMANALSKVPADEIRNPRMVEAVESAVTQNLGAYTKKFGVVVDFRSQGGIRLPNVLLHAEQRKAAAREEAEANRIEAEGKAAVIQIFTKRIVNTAQDLGQPISVNDALLIAANAAGRDQWTDVARDTRAPLSLIMNTSGPAGPAEARRIGGPDDTPQLAEVALSLAQQNNQRLDELTKLLKSAPDSPE